jgi:hypothetical protein
MIKDIMDGRAPRPPHGWEESGTPTGGAPAKDDKVPVGPTVGPAAGQH